jgi:hypothetical protein
MQLLRRGNGQGKRERAALAHRAFHLQLPALTGHKLAGNAQSQAAPTLGGQLAKTLKNTLLQFGRDAGALVLHAHLHVLAGGQQAGPDA